MGVINTITSAVGKETIKKTDDIGKETLEKADEYLGEEDEFEEPESNLEAELVKIDNQLEAEMKKPIENLSWIYNEMKKKHKVKPAIFIKKKIKREQFGDIEQWAEGILEELKTVEQYEKPLFKKIGFMYKLAKDYDDGFEKFISRNYKNSPPKVKCHKATHDYVSYITRYNYEPSPKSVYFIRKIHRYTELMELIKDETNRIEKKLERLKRDLKGKNLVKGKRTKPEVLNDLFDDGGRFLEYKNDHEIRKIKRKFRKAKKIEVEEDMNRLTTGF